MTRCQAFYEKWEKDPNFCDKSLATVKRIDHYLDLVHELEEAGADAGAIYRKFSEGTAREILNLKATPEMRKSIIDNAAGLIIRGEKVSVADIRAWSGVRDLPIGSKSTPDNGVKKKASVVQDEDGHVEERPIEPAPVKPAPTATPPTLPPDAPMRDVLKRDEELLVAAQKHTPKTQEQIRKEKAEQLDRAVNAMLDLMSSKPRNHIKELKEKYIQFETQADVIDMALDFMAEKWKP
jgi:hypothetical protein